MRSYNFVVDITPDIEGNQYRIRAIDFDQQSYEGKLRLYMPQYFKENNNLVFMGIDSINEKTMKQYQQEERSIIGHRNHHGNLKAVFVHDDMSLYPLYFFVPIIAVQPSVVSPFYALAIHHT